VNPDVSLSNPLHKARVTVREERKTTESEVSGQAEVANSESIPTYSDKLLKSVLGCTPKDLQRGIPKDKIFWEKEDAEQSLSNTKNQIEQVLSLNGFSEDRINAVLKQVGIGVCLDAIGSEGYAVEFEDLDCLELLLGNTSADLNKGFISAAKHRNTAALNIIAKQMGKVPMKTLSDALNICSITNVLQDLVQQAIAKL
jgi:hypothetical protein